MTVPTSLITEWLAPPSPAVDRMSGKREDGSGTDVDCSSRD